jgi:hypothetical protein
MSSPLQRGEHLLVLRVVSGEKCAVAPTMDRARGALPLSITMPQSRTCACCEEVISKTRVLTLGPPGWRGAPCVQAALTFG